jgi:hypothetical protein
MAAIAGVIIGIAGLAVNLSSSARGARAQRKSLKYARLASDVRLQQQGLANAITRRDSVRQYRATAARSAAMGTADGNVVSSSLLGVQSSQMSQEAFNLDYFSQQAALDGKYNEYNKQAGQWMSTANTAFAVAGEAQQIASTFNSIYGYLKAPTKTPPPPPPPPSPSPTPSTPTPTTPSSTPDSTPASSYIDPVPITTGNNA